MSGASSRNLVQAAPREWGGLELETGACRPQVVSEVGTQGFRGRYPDKGQAVANRGLWGLHMQWKNYMLLALWKLPSM
jgi:hypothetical protein